MMLNCRIEAMRIPASPASDEASAHDACCTRTGRPPAIASRSGLSTTARIAMPSRVSRNIAPSASAMATVAATATTLCQDTSTDASRKPSPLKNCGSVRTTVGFQTSWATPTSASSRPSVTTTVMSTAAPYSGRISTRSTTTPNTGAMTRRTRSRESTALMCHPCHSCQKVNAAIIPTAPWAKLKMPVVV
jgi:hypothetical protein